MPKSITTSAFSGVRHRMVFLLLAAVSLLHSAQPNAADVWRIREGKGYGLCDSLHARLQKHRPPELGRCATAVALSLPGMREFDDWKELNAEQHEALYKQIIQYDAMGVLAYFDPQHRGAKNQLDDAALDKAWRGFTEIGGRMRVKTIQLIRHPLGEPHITYTRPQTILELRRKRYPFECPKAPALVDNVQSYYVTPDLSRPDPEILPYEAGIARFSRLVEYKGIPHLMYGDSSLSFYREFQREGTHGTLRRYCEIEQVQ